MTYTQPIISNHTSDLFPIESQKMRKKGLEKLTYYKIIYHSPLGPLSLVADESGLRGAWFVDQKYFERGLSGQVIEASNPFLEQTAQLLDAYFASQDVDFSSLTLADVGTDFQKRVWTYLSQIPKGQTVTYGQIARDLDVASAQAVGGAVGRNPFSVIIPCHRVLGSQGQMTGYAGGLDKKLWLLNHEAAKIDRKK